MTNSNASKVTIVVVPRERHSLVLKCMEYIYAFAPQPFNLIVVDPNSPPQIADELQKRQSKNSNLTVLRSEKFIMPHEAKNWAVEKLSPETEWVIFLDNDVMVSPHFVTWMLKAAEETGARCVHPLYLIEQTGGDISIHMADGMIQKGQKNGKHLIQPIMNYVGMNIANASKFVRKESGFLEFHAFMLRRDLLREMGPFEPVTLSEDVHYSLRLSENNERIIFEPNAVITYIAGPPFEKYDLPYYRYRWSPKFGNASSGWLKQRWPQVLNAYWDIKLRWMHFHRQRIEPWFPVVTLYQKYSVESRTVRKLGKMLPVLNRL